MLRHTQQRTAIRSALARAGRPLSPQELLTEARREIPEIGQATIYRAIKAMVAEQLAVEVKVPGEPDRYEAAGKHHHHHFLCRACKRMFEMEGCPGNLQAMAPPGFSVEGHELTLYGHCPSCTTPPSATRRRKLNAAAALLFVLGFLLAPLLHQLETTQTHAHHDADHCGLCQMAHLPALDAAPERPPQPSLVGYEPSFIPVAITTTPAHFLRPYSCGPPAFCLTAV